MNSLKNPMFMTSAVCLIGGLIALAANAMVGFVVIVIAFLTCIAGYIINARRTNRGDPAAGLIRLQNPPH